MSVLQIERALSFKKGGKKKTHERFRRPSSALGKQSADNQSRRRKEVESRERRGDGGEETWATAECFMSGTQKISQTDNGCCYCTHSAPLRFPLSLSRSLSDSLYQCYRSCLSPVCSGSLFLTRFTTVSRRCTKQSWAEVGSLSLAQLLICRKEVTRMERAAHRGTICAKIRGALMRAAHIC